MGCVSFYDTYPSVSGLVHLMIWLCVYMCIMRICVSVSFAHLCSVPRAGAPGGARSEYSGGTLVWDPASHHRRAEIHKHNVNIFHTDLMWTKSTNEGLNRMKRLLSNNSACKCITLYTFCRLLLKALVG